MIRKMNRQKTEKYKICQKFGEANNKKMNIKIEQKYRNNQKY